jgi:hypothetical protein
MTPCPRCGSATPSGDLARFGGVCLSCIRAIAAEEDDPPAIPGLEIQGRIGRGGMGVVYRARHERLGRTVAVKILGDRAEVDPGFLPRFEQEARTLAQLSHPGIVAVHDAGVHEGVPYLVMELVEGKSLRERGRLDRAETARIALDLCDALTAAHAKGVVHRDLKPENVLFDGQGRVKLVDFGLALPDTGSRLTRSGAVLGTPAYMAPEQIERPASVDVRADLYALGVIVYEMLTGELPLGRFRRPSEIAPSLRSWDGPVLRLLEKDPARRFAGALEAKEALRGASLPRPSRAGGVAAGLAALALLAGAGWWISRPPSPGVWEELAGSASEGGISRTPGYSVFPSMALDPAGRPVLAWDDGPAGAPRMLLRRWTGTAWEELAGSATGDGLGGAVPAQDATTAVDAAGNPVVAWRTQIGGNWEVYLRRWSGRAWEELGGSATGGGVSSSASVSWAPAVRVDRLGRPVVAWHEQDAAGTRVYLRRWEGRAWRDLGGPVGAGGWPALALDAADQPVVAWIGRTLGVSRWNGSVWTTLPELPPEAQVAKHGLEVDRKGHPILAWRTKSTGELRISRWDGSRWIQEGPALGPASIAALALDAQDRPIVAWSDEAAIHVRRWTDRWEEVGAAGPVAAGKPTVTAVAVDPEGRILVAWSAKAPSGLAEIYLRRWRR